MTGDLYRLPKPCWKCSWPVLGVTLPLAGVLGRIQMR